MVRHASWLPLCYGHYLVLISFVPGSLGDDCLRINPQCIALFSASNSAPVRNTARWSRTQLLGEIARGHWGLCRASVADLIAPPEGRWAELEGRMAFAPVTEMTEDFMRNAEEEMAARRAQVVVAAGETAAKEDQESEELASGAGS